MRNEMPRTIRGFAFDECASALQKAIRRGDGRIASFFANELVASNYIKYVWKRLLVVSAEDVFGPLTSEVESLMRSCMMIRQEQRVKKATDARIFVTKAVILLCRAVKCRDADDLNVLGYDSRVIPDSEAREYIQKYECNGEGIEIPEYALDVHTKRGRLHGATKTGFMERERDALNPKAPSQMTLWE